MKHIVCVGCSFTRQPKKLNINCTDLDFMQDSSNMYRWPHYLKKYLSEENYTIYNLGGPTNDNSIIRKLVIWKVDKLIKSGIKTEDIQVFIQWSSWQRNSFYISPKHSISKETDISLPKNDENLYAHITDFIENKNKPGEFGYYLLTGGGNYNHIPYKIKELIPNYYLNFFSLEESLIRFFENILFVQNFLNLKKINYLCFNIHNNFSKIYTSVDGFPNYFNGNDFFKSLYIDKYIPKTIDNDYNLTYNNEYIDHLFNQIDLNKFWFLKNDETLYGGLMEWAIKTYDIYNDVNKNGLWMEWDNYEIHELKESLNNKNIYPLGHISNMMNDFFVKDILLKYV